MSDERKNIQTKLNTDIEQDKLLQYLNGNMAAAEQHAFEQQMNDDEFMNDAVEGLQQIVTKNKIPFHVKQLNSSLRNLLDASKKRRKKKGVSSLYWTYIAITLLLILLITTYLMIKRAG